MKGGSQMLIPTLVLAALAVALLIWGRLRGSGEEVQGLKIGMRMVLEVLPLLVFAFIVAGMVQVLIPREALGRWIGTGSGLRGILVGTVAGALAPGGPYVSLPIVAGLMRAGASVGTLVAFLTGWSLWAVGRLPMEFGILGWKFTLARLASTFIFPPLAGLIAQAFFRNWK
jgi:uncharacterized membrane protein YraQ (UPF0718 family)